MDEDFKRIIHQAGNTNNHQPIGLSSLNRIAHNRNFGGKIKIKKFIEMSVCFFIIKKYYHSTLKNIIYN